MKNCRKKVSLFFLIGLMAVLSAAGFAQTGEDLPVSQDGTTVTVDESAEMSAAPLSVPEAQPAPATVKEPEVPAVPQAAAPEASFSKPAPAPAAQAEAPAPSNLSGVVEIEGFKYPVYLYVPRGYKNDRTYSLILIAPSETMRTQEQMDYLEGLAQRRSIFILLPCVLWPKPGDVPTDLDTWLLGVKKEVLDRFPINRNRTYLVGKNSGAHYAAYLATSHPQEFAAAALLGDAWDGTFKQLIKPSSAPAKQIPFFVALKAGTDAKARNQYWFDEMQKKGYLLRLYEYQKDEELDELEFKKEVYDWLEEANQTWSAAVAKSRQGWKARFKKGVKDFFKV